MEVFVHTFMQIAVGKSSIWKIDTIPIHLEQLHFITHSSHNQSSSGDLITISTRSTSTSSLGKNQVIFLTSKNYSLTHQYTHILSKQQENWKDPTIPASHSHDTVRVKLQPNIVFAPCLRVK